MTAIVVTGAAGFIGYHVTERLIARGDQVIGIDSLNDYYDPSLKRARLGRLLARPGFTFLEGDLADAAWLTGALSNIDTSSIVHLAAQAGVRYSIDNPAAYVQSNLVGFANVLEVSRALRVRHLVYASSSSVYGANTKVPFAVGDPVDTPVSLYAATKKSNELMAHVYSHLFGIPVTGLRFFTVYGPWGRPDMAYYSFTRAILAGRPIPIFNNGELSRDFTFVDDVVEGVIRVLDRPPAPEPLGAGTVAAKVYNIGNSAPVRLLDFVRTLESALGRKAELDYQPMQPGDVMTTYADVAALEAAVGYRPTTDLAEGLSRFVKWYREYHDVAAD